METKRSDLVWEVKSSGRRRRKIHLFIIIGAQIIYGVSVWKKNDLSEMGNWYDRFLLSFLMTGFALLVLIPYYKWGMRNINKPTAIKLEIDPLKKVIHLRIEKAKKKYRRGLPLDIIAFEIETEIIKGDEFKILTIYEVKTGTRGQPLYYEICELIDGKRRSTWREKQLVEISNALRQNGVLERGKYVC